MKIFVSYSRQDAGDFAKQIQSYFTRFKHDIFTDTEKIEVGDTWSSTIETNISSCDIFVIIVTYGALQSQHVEDELSQAKRENKKIIPCFDSGTKNNQIKWGLNKIQGVEFDDKYELVRKSKIIQNKSAVKINGVDNTSETNSTTTTTISSRPAYQSVQWYIDRAEKFDNLQEYDEAIKMYDKAIEKEPDNVSIYLK